MRRSSGFTLIELMITVAIVAILAAIAYPSYATQLRKSRRAEAQTALMEIAARQQQMLLDTRSYTASLTTLGITVPTGVQQRYTVAIVAGATTPPSFTASASPIGDQANDKCATLSITETGAKSPVDCW